MHVFTDGRSVEPTRDALARVEGALRVGGCDGALEALIEWGVVESALLDALQPDTDDALPLRDRLRALAHQAGEAFVLTVDGRDPAPVLRRLAEGLALRGLPPTIEPRIPEGYAWYGLHPARWVDAARAFARAHRPERVTVVGLRSIGTSLSAAVVAALTSDGIPARSVAVRPRGDPFDRRLVLGRRLAADLLDGLRGPGWFLVVDEGPGLSGSSLVGAAKALGDLGVPIDRIALLPAHEPDPARLVSPTARAWWPRLGRFVGPDRHPFPGAIDLGGGRWRDRFAPGARALPLYERRKLWLDGPTPRIARFAGLGRWGRATLARAERLAAEGFGPPVRGLVDGHLVLDVVDGRPVSGPVPPDLVAHAARYVAARSRWTTNRPVPFDELVELVRSHAAEALGPRFAALADRLGRLEAVARSAPTVAIDNRLDPVEWIAGPRGFTKVDGVDHCADHGLPGCQDVAWDVAGLTIELGATRGQAVAGFGRDRRDLLRRLPLYEAAYAAWRLGYADLALRAVDPADAPPWRAARARYLAHLRRTLLRSRS